MAELDVLKRFLEGLVARQTMQRQFLGLLLRQLASEGFDLEELAAQLERLAAALPRTPPDLAQAGRDEHQALTEMVERLIAEEQGD